MVSLLHKEAKLRKSRYSSAKWNAWLEKSFLRSVSNTEGRQYLNRSSSVSRSRVSELA